MGSSTRLFRDEQSSRRKEISRLFETKRKTIAFYMRWSFFLIIGLSKWLERVVLILTMINKQKSRISIVTLIICLCLGSLVISQFNQINPFVPEIFGIEAENFDLFDHTEFDDDLFVILIVGTKFTRANYSKSRTANLGYLSASLTPVSPPPKHS